MKIGTLSIFAPRTYCYTERCCCCCCCCYRLSTLLTQHRCVVQHPRSGLTIVEDYNERKKYDTKLLRNKNGNVYRRKQKLWPSEFAYECALTEAMYTSAERTPLMLLPMRSKPRRSLLCEGANTSHIQLLEREEQQQQEKEEEQHGEESSLVSLSSLKSRQEGSVNQEVALMEELMCTSSSSLEVEHANVNDKILTDDKLVGTTLASAIAHPRHPLEHEIEESPHDNNYNNYKRSILPTSYDAAGITWSGLGFDPVLAYIAHNMFGNGPTRVQARLLPLLLHEDHNDVLLNGMTGTGKTGALLLALLNGVRNETVGMNVLVSAHTMHAKRAYDTIKAMCRKHPTLIDGQVVDRDAEDESWLMLATYREEWKKYYKQLQSSLHSPQGPVRLLITTADVMCELFFMAKMEYKEFGYLRRLYVDDVAEQIPTLDKYARKEDVKERLRNPLAAELLLGTVHQLPGPHIRSIIQLGLVSANVEVELKDHLQSLCMKPTAQSVVLSPVRVPSTTHCVFSFHLFNENVYAYTAKLIWNARATIPGRAILFVSNNTDILHVRRTLRGLGMNVKILSEVYAHGSYQDKWKFLLLRESEAFGIDVPLVSHVFITFTPSSWESYLHMCGRVSRMGNVGWVYTIADRKSAPMLRQITEALHIDLCQHVVDSNLQRVDSALVDRLSKKPELYPLDPQFVVKRQYEYMSDAPQFSHHSREFFSKPLLRNFQLEDYTDVNELQRRYKNALKLARDVRQNPKIVAKMQEAGLLDSALRPTQHLKRNLNYKTSEFAPSPFDEM